MSDKMHLLAFMMHTPINHMTMSWADADDAQAQGLSSISHWQDLARTLERGYFDGMFFADVPAVYDHYQDNTDVAIRYGVNWPTHDPVALIGIMAAATSHLGIASTVSTASQHPFLAVRALTSLDFLSGGRVGWNIVTGNARSEHRAMGLDFMGHDQRYDRAEEYMQICYALWRGIPKDAVLQDKKNGIFADPSKIEKIAFDGEYLSCHATPSVLPSPQGRPVLFQAGSSGRGQQFAVSHADVIFAIQPDLARMQTFMAQIRAAGKANKRRDPVRVTFAIQPFIGETLAGAEAKRDAMLARIPLEAALTRISGTFGIDLDTVDIDLPLQEISTQASQGLVSAMSSMFGDKNITLREAVRLSGLAGMIPQILGTPEDVADQLEEIWRQTGCHGFNLTPAIVPGGYEEFVDQVVPLLQQRGIFRTEYEADTLRGNMID
ncbi:MAG: NtaA/DmoA family FMN-dependent monooxygenase [Rhodospirillaceae bacterium]|nr:NtaA/DmoA family FMN-dependent monooxygenase [Rhodospirillaceae bacterium]MBT4042671.1 NtaA/DmoA family FMN-dependent monooxygenase [Rhodospirillaceae bacterium]MBT4687760.1 NtaA/DmoA family FMN-dependent monooxygenase [Rhodospirillaceae bacterium]MBT5082816.1 NtaA/DmoA family FMN-dependent monooxygenase [Rhodospirillaceae bacterium]MBT5524260.1 NtaA/DmoA family FMN-dependent monooxygenase [Rhodospirillaceae bacterium]